MRGCSDARPVDRNAQSADWSAREPISLLTEWCGSSCPPLRSKLAFEPPCVAIGGQRLASPVERVGGDLREAPPRLCAVGTCAQLNDVFSAPAADQILVVAPTWIFPETF